MTTAVQEKTPQIKKLVDQRGNCMGYMVEGVSIHWNNGPSVDLRQKVPTLGNSTSQRAKSSFMDDSGEVEYRFLRRATYDDEECPYCSHYPNQANRQMVNTSDMGRQRVVKCGACDKFFKPY